MDTNIGNILIYQNEKGDTKVDAYFNDDTIWMTQRSISELYQISKSSVSEHIKNIYLDRELDENSTVRKFRTVQTEGSRQVSREMDYYNLDMVLAVGYRVRSNIGIHFRNWASSILSEYMRKGFALNDERLKNPKKFGQDYFDELLERIRDIRASEKRVYMKVRDIFATSVDYDPKSEQADRFFKTVQNKLHYSVHGHTAPELIHERADATKDNMGLTSFKGAKVTMYLDYAEDQAKQRIPMYMSDWENRLNAFLQFTGRKVLDNNGHISREDADRFAKEQYEIFDYHRKALESHSEELDILPVLPEEHK